MAKATCGSRSESLKSLNIYTQLLVSTDLLFSCEEFIASRYTGALMRGAMIEVPRDVGGDMNEGEN